MGYNEIFMFNLIFFTTLNCYLSLLLILVTILNCNIIYYIFSLEFFKNSDKGTVRDSIQQKINFIYYWFYLY